MQINLPQPFLFNHVGDNKDSTILCSLSIQQRPAMITRQARNCWTYTEAQATVEKVKPLLTDLRKSYIKWKHYERLAKKNHKHQLNSKHWKQIAQTTLDALLKLGVVVYEQPFHGVVLFPFKVTKRAIDKDKKVTDKVVDAFFVYCDTKNLIENFVFRSTVEKKDKLRGGMKPIPDAWVNEQSPYRY